MKKTILGAVLFCAIALSTRPAHAQWAVIDGAAIALYPPAASGQ